MLLRPSSRVEAAEFDRLRAAGLLTRLLCDVHAPADIATCARTRALAAGALLSGVLRTAVVGHESAAWVYCGASVTGGWPPDVLVVLLARQRGRTLAEPVVTRQADLAPDDVVEVARIKVTSPARTGADTARMLPADAAIAVLDELALRTSVTPREISDVLDRMHHARGLMAARDVLAEWAAISRRRGDR